MFNKRFDRVVNMKEAKKKQKEFQEQLEKEPLEKGDIPAMLLAAAAVFVPAIIVVLAILGFVIWFFFLR